MSCIKPLVDQCNHLFDKRLPMLSLWQEIAENFYSERADFTTCRNVGEEMSRGLMSSYPVVARRQLGDAFGAMLRPTAKEWFHTRTNRPDREDTTDKQWLEWAGKFQRNVMYDKRAQFSRATKEADHDFAAFGQAVISVEMNPGRDGLLFRCWHLRDVAWMEDYTGQITTIYRRWKPTVSDLCAMADKNPKTFSVSQKVREKRAKDPFAEVNVIHCIKPADEYAAMEGGKEFKQPFVSCFIDTDHDHEMECVGSWTSHYVIPRWSTVSGSQYAHSPAIVAALPDARLLQSVTRTLLEAGEKAVNPPMIGVQEAIRSDLAIYAGGFTVVDAEYDERLGEVLRPLNIDTKGLNFGMEWAGDLRVQLSDALYLSKLNLPPVGGPDMTAYEVGQRVQEFIRNALPLFEPMEQNYNGQLCDQVFDLLLPNVPEFRASIPRHLAGAEVDFQFESPLRDAIEKVKIGQLTEASQILAAAMQLDPSVALIVDNHKAVRSALEAAVPADWLRTDADVQKMAAEQAAQAQSQQLLATMQQGADVAKTLAESGTISGRLPNA